MRAVAATDCQPRPGLRPLNHPAAPGNWSGFFHHGLSHGSLTSNRLPRPTTLSTPIVPPVGVHDGFADGQAEAVVAVGARAGFISHLPKRHAADSVLGGNSSTLASPAWRRWPPRCRGFRNEMDHSGTRPMPGKSSTCHTLLHPAGHSATARLRPPLATRRTSARPVSAPRAGAGPSAGSVRMPRASSGPIDISVMASSASAGPSDSIGKAIYYRH